MRKGWRLMDAALLVKTRRPQVRPCTAYLEQLLELERFKFGANSCCTDDLAAFLLLNHKQHSDHKHSRHAPGPAHSLSVDEMPPSLLATTGLATALVSAGLFHTRLNTSSVSVQQSAQRRQRSPWGVSRETSLSPSPSMLSTQLPQLSQCGTVCTCTCTCVAAVNAAAAAVCACTAAVNSATAEGAAMGGTGTSGDDPPILPAIHSMCQVLSMPK
eukprot:TRINITY_DN5098_c0_g1_i2.p1 TRINITY_DN5098_c0_g1~~TRINITY_DN5098_c0_g1_i2.p1  ORF type:complete len:215 (-),score=46.04 TRINITY_DN5098_c0_g1_i2:82-726(-)